LGYKKEGGYYEVDNIELAKLGLQLVIEETGK
jgi:hypothetical protein